MISPNAPRWTIALTALVASFISMAASSLDAQQPEAPDLIQPQRVVEGYFESLPDFKRSDLITQSQIVAVLAALQADGWQVADPERIVRLGVADQSFLARELATRDGRKFMRQIARLPDGYSQLDRLSTIPHGERIVRDLIRQPGGDQFVKYLTTTQGGRNLGKMLAAAPRATDLTKPTGKIYTVDNLLAELRRSVVQPLQ